MDAITRKKSICFAYFGDGNFIGWYSDTFGSITKNEPKVYTYSEKQVATVTSNFNYKLSKLKELSDFVDITGNVGLKPLDNSLDADKTNLRQYKIVELRIVECPEYDGPNPDFDNSAYTKKVADRKAKMESEGIYNLPAASQDRFNAVKRFEEKYGKVECNNWIYADYTKVKEWASIEPTEFIDSIKSEA